MTRVKAVTAGTPFLLPFPLKTLSKTHFVSQTETNKNPKLSLSLNQNRQFYSPKNSPKFSFMEDFVHLVRRGSTVSELTGSGRSSDSVEHQAESHMIESTPTEWTDEKHSLYLKSMEASFVDQLYNTSDLHDWRSEKDGLADTLSSRKLHASSYISSGQFKVLQGGCWSKINFKRNESQQMTKPEQSCALPPSPWIRHFKSGSRQHVAPEPAVQGKSAPALQQFLVCGDYLCRQDSTGNTEVCDQNFPDEDVAKERTSRMSSAKRMRTSVVSSPSNDQVVPLGLFPMMEDTPEN